MINVNRDFLEYELANGTFFLVQFLIFEAFRSFIIKLYKFRLGTRLHSNQPCESLTSFSFNVINVSL